MLSELTQGVDYIYIDGPEKEGEKKMKNGEAGQVYIFALTMAQIGSTIRYLPLFQIYCDLPADAFRQYRTQSKSPKRLYFLSIRSLL